MSKLKLPLRRLEKGAGEVSTLWFALHVRCTIMPIMPDDAPKEPPWSFYSFIMHMCTLQLDFFASSYFTAKAFYIKCMLYCLTTALKSLEQFR